MINKVSLAMDIEVTRRFLKAKLRRDSATFYGFERERNQVKGLFERTAKEGESNSALLIAPKNGGKTSLVNCVLLELLQDNTFSSQALIVSLDGLVHTDDRSALKSTSKQMNLEKETEGKVFNSFSENLTFLLSCLRNGQDARRLIFIIENFDHFCAHHNQTLLYNLFDVAQSAQAPICVLGITHRTDVIELLEKRVKSRFSYRQILLMSESEDFDGFLATFADLLKLPMTDGKLSRKSSGKQIIENVNNLPFMRRLFDPCAFDFSKKYVKEWNESIEKLTNNERLVTALQNFYDRQNSIGALKQFLFQIVSKLDAKCTTIEVKDVTKLIDQLIGPEDTAKLVAGLSVLEICLLISIKHHCDIYDNEPFNFEIIFARFCKFAIKSTTMQNIEREMALKRFENLKHQELIAPFGADGKVQKEYQMHRALVLPEHIDRAIQQYQNLPTEVEQWAKSSII